MIRDRHPRGWEGAIWPAPLAPLLAATGLAAVGLGLVASSGGLLPLLVAGAMGILLLSYLNVGIVLGLLIVVVLNGVPLLDLNEFAVPGAFRVSDAALVALIGYLAASIAIRQTAAAVLGIPRLVRIALIVLAGWWLVTLVRTIIFADVGFLLAALAAREYLYFALLVPLLVAGLTSSREIHGMLAVIAILSAVAAMGQIGVTALNADIGLIHAEFLGEDVGVTRLYTPMSDAMLLLLCLALGLLFLGTSAAQRIVGFAGSALAGAAIGLGLTRAVYVALALALTAVTIQWLRRGGPEGRRMAHATVAAVVAIAGLSVAGSVVFRFGDQQVAQAVAQRVIEAPRDVVELTGSFGYRYRLAGTMIDTLGGQFVTGLGFLHPEAHFAPGIPGGNIRSSDVGVLNSIMTLGLIGTIALYTVVLAPLRRLVATSRAEDSVGTIRPWLHYGLATWLLATVIGSLTLVTLHRVTGLALSATVVAVTLHVHSVRERSDRTKGLYPRRLPLV